MPNTGTAGTAATVNTGVPRFLYLYSIPQVTDVDAANSAAKSTKDNYSLPGFIDDLNSDTVTNPLTGTGVSYCQCWSVVENACDPNISTLADGTTKAAKVMESATNFQRADNFAEYSVVQAAIKKIARHTDEQCH